MTADDAVSFMRLFKAESGQDTEKKLADWWNIFSTAASPPLSPGMAEYFRKGLNEGTVTLDGFLFEVAGVLLDNSAGLEAGESDLSALVIAAITKVAQEFQQNFGAADGRGFGWDDWESYEEPREAPPADRRARYWFQGQYTDDRANWNPANSTQQPAIGDNWSKDGVRYETIATAEQAEEISRAMRKRPDGIAGTRREERPPKGRKTAGGRHPSDRGDAIERSRRKEKKQPPGLSRVTISVAGARKSKRLTKDLRQSLGELLPEGKLDQAAARVASGGNGDLTLLNSDGLDIRMTSGEKPGSAVLRITIDRVQRGLKNTAELAAVAGSSGSFTNFLVAGTRVFFYAGELSLQARAAAFLASIDETPTASGRIRSELLVEKGRRWPVGKPKRTTIISLEGDNVPEWAAKVVYAEIMSRGPAGTRTPARTPISPAAQESMENKPESPSTTGRLAFGQPGELAEEIRRTELAGLSDIAIRNIAQQALRIVLTEDSRTDK